jgi:hypothetical protein
MNALARAAMEAGAQLWWLLEPQIGVRRRVARFRLIRAQRALHLDGAVQKTDPAAPPGAYGETPAMVQAAVAGLGLKYNERQLRDGKWSRSCEGETLRGYTARATAFEAAACRRTAWWLMPSDSRALAATPSPSPIKMCSVPMWSWLNVLASS